MSTEPRAAEVLGQGPPAPAASRMRARVDGTVQGVGFRPFVFRLAEEMALGGYVLNDERGVVLEVEGDRPAVELFFVRLRAEAPPLARVERVSREPVPPRAEREFAIVESKRRGEPSAPVAADIAPCDECLRELFDPGDRRFRYPFVNCTNCGPRLTIVRGVPYDRPLTTMAGFEMCEACLAEYRDPRDRRFHAQPNACPQCGPSVTLLDAGGTAVEPASGVRDAVAAAARALGEGAILAAKGIGGYHLACRADDEATVAALRGCKHREDKPFALMAPSLAHAHTLVTLGAAEADLLRSRRRPIVIAPRRSGATVAESVAPRSTDLGVMLPYSPLHHVLLADSGVTLVMTSGNVSDEPIAYADGDALGRLAGIADLFLVHDRPIHTRTDDSVARVTRSGRPLVMRRSRGYVPESVDLPVPADRPILACGAELKSTFCVAKGPRAWVGPHVGDLKNYETLRSFKEGIDHFERLFAVRPEVVVHDLHPDYLSTRYALDREDVDHIGVQHHHAHLGACLAEHGEDGPAVGAIFDGTGYGSDGSVWGGELLAGGLGGFERAGFLWPVRMPGGERAIHEPWRMAAAWLVAALGDEPRLPRTLADTVGESEWRKVCELASKGLASPVTTSMGRLFDAVAALCGIRARVNYEGQAAVELEGACDAAADGTYPMPVLDGPATLDGPVTLDGRATIRAVVADLDAGVAPGLVSARFHAAVADATAHACALLCERRSLETVVLSGGVFQNRTLLDLTRASLAEGDLRVLVPERLPPNDGGISYGQAAIAAFGLRRSGTG